MTKDPQKKDAILRATVRLDREERSSYTLRVKAKDRGNPVLSSETTVTVNIVDINDNNPDFTENTYKGSVKETAAVNTYVLRVNISLQPSFIAV